MLLTKIILSKEMNTHYQSRITKREYLFKVILPFTAVSYILKLWVANAKRYLRGIDCESDINRMYKKVFGHSGKTAKDMLLGTLEYLKGNCNPALYEYITSCEKCAKRI